MNNPQTQVFTFSKHQPFCQQPIKFNSYNATTLTHRHTWPPRSKSERNFPAWRFFQRSHGFQYGI